MRCITLSFRVCLLCLCFCIHLNNLQNWVLAEENMQNYLNEKLMYVKNELNKIVQKRDTEVDLKFDPIGIHSLSNNRTTAHTFVLFDKFFLLMDARLYQLDPNNNTSNYTPHKQLPEIHENVLFVKNFEFSNLGLIFIALSNGHSHVYGHLNATNKNQIFLIQSIKNTDHADDANFFMDAGHLYLGIANRLGNFLSPFSIYKWTKTHFDEISTVLLRNSSKILSFDYQQTEIIVVYENITDDNLEPNLIIYEFKNDGLVKVQTLIVKDYQEIVTYKVKNERYLVIFQQNENSIVYQWKDSGFVNSREFDNYSGISQSQILENESGCFIFLLQQDYILIFGHTPIHFLHLVEKVQLPEKVEKILDAKLFACEDKKSLLIFYAAEENKLNYANLSFTEFPRELQKIEAAQLELEEIFQCLDALENRLNATAKKLAYNKRDIKNVQWNDYLKYRETISVNAPVYVNSIKSRSVSTKYQYNVTELRGNVSHLNTKIKALRPKLEVQGKNWHIHGNLKINGKLHVKQLQTQTVYVNRINEKQWAPDTWLSYSKPQTIENPVSFTNLHVNNLRVTSNNENFDNLLIRNGDQILSDEYILNSLTADDIHTTSINGISLDDVYLQSPIIIPKTKKVQNVSTDPNFTNKVENSKALQQIEKLKSGRFRLSPNMRIKNFNFETINGIDWNTFKNSVFRFNQTDRIQGNMTFTSGLNVSNFFPKTIDNVNVSNLFTTITEQTITSSIMFADVVAPNVSCYDINGFNIEKDVVSTTNNVVEGPVSIGHINIRKNLFINGPSGNIMETLDNHVIGTKESDLAQIYNKKVKILGNLRLNNLVIHSSTDVLVNNRKFHEKTVENYWLKSNNQVVPVHFVAQRGMNVQHLSCTSLNNVPINNYVLNNLNKKLPANLIFQNATIVGNVFVNQSESHRPDLFILDKICVKTSGRYQIKGQIIVKGTLNVGNMITGNLDEIPLSNVLSSTSSSLITGKKTFESLIIQENLICEEIDADLLNNVDLKSLLDRTLFLDRFEQVHMMTFTDFAARNLFIENVNQVNLGQYLLFLNNVYEMTTLNNVLVNGDVWAKNIQGLQKMNNYEFDILSTNTVLLQDDLVFENNIIFNENVHADILEVVNINNIDFQHLVSVLLYKNWNQNITFPYTFDRINAPNIYVPQINDIRTKYLINKKNVNPQDLQVWGGLQLSLPKFLKSLNAEKSNCDLDSAIAYMKNPSTRYWNSVHIEHNVSLWDGLNDIDNILRNVVNSKETNVIVSRIILRQSVSSNFVDSEKFINNVNLTWLFSDAVMKDVAEQTITGDKKFLRLATSHVLVGKDTRISIVNKIDVVTLNQSIIFKNYIYDDVIRGEKIFFGGLQAIQLNSNSVSDINVENLVDLSNFRVIPKAHFHSLEIKNNFDFDYCNQINVSYILSERLINNADEEQIAYGTYYFDDLLLKGNSYTPVINDLIIEDIVIDNGVQDISSTKIFEQDFVANGNIVVEYLNSVDISQAYRESILLGETNLINEAITFDNLTIIRFNIATESINDVSVDYLKYFLQESAPVIETTEMHKTLDEIKRVVNTSLDMTKDMFVQYLYLEKSNDLQISLPNVENVEIVKIQDDLMFYITQHQPGLSCGLSIHCICPLQNVLQVSPGYSVSFLTDTHMKRTFSYEDKEITSHLFTNIISTNENCRINQSPPPINGDDESTSLVVMVHSKNTSGSFFYPKLLTSYISDVKYFISKNNTYMIISRFYDHINNTHELDCQVYKFIKTEGKIDLIQSINTNRVWKLYILPTTGGVLLIINRISTVERFKQVLGAEIYRFDDISEQFILLRKVQKNSYVIATGVALEDDSLIILGKAESPSLEILKYHSIYDNYYFHQYIPLDSPATGISTSYRKDYGIDNAYLYVVTESNMYYIYNYHYVEGWKLLSNGEIRDLKSLIPFSIKCDHFLLAISSEFTSVLNKVMQGVVCD